MSKFSSKENYFKFILYFIVIILINFAGMTLFFRIDLTQNKLYSLSQASKDVVATLSEPLTIKVFFSKNLPAPHNNTERYLHDLLEEYSSQSGKFFNYKFYNVSPEDAGLKQTSDENREMAKNYGINPVQIRILENDEFKSKNAYMGLVIIHGDLIEKLPAITSTDGLQLKLTTSIQKLNNKVSALMRLDKKIKIQMYLSSALNKVAPLIGLDQLPQFGDKVKELISKVNQKSLDKIEFKYLDLSNPQEIDAVSKQYGLMALKWPDVPDKGIFKGQGIAGVVLEYKGSIRTLPLLNSIEVPIFGTQYQMADLTALEETITTVMEKMIGINKNIGYLSSHGALALEPDRLAMMQGRPGGGLQVFNHLISQRYSINSVNLKENEISQGLNCLIVAKPTEKFSDYELFQIDQALMNGTNLALFMDKFEEKAPPQGGGFGMPPRYEPIDSGLEKLLEHYGLRIKKAILMDEECYINNNPRNPNNADQKIYFAPMLKEDSINNEPGFMKNIKGLVVMQISPLEIIDDKIDKNKVTATKLLSSSDKAWIVKDNIQLNPMFIFPPQSEDGFESYDMAYILEGKFTSFFNGKDLPKKTQDEKDITEDKDNGVEKPSETLANVVSENRFVKESKPGKIFVLACTQVLQDNMLDQEGRSSNATFILNVIDHLNDQDKIAAMRSKQQTLNPLAETTPAVRSLIKIFNIAALPFLVVLFGFGVWIKRTSRKKKIKMMFEE